MKTPAKPTDEQAESMRRYVSRRFKDRIEQALHFILLGVALAYLCPPLAIAVYLIREFSDWKLPWPLKGQWPPGQPYTPPNLYSSGGKRVTQLERVEDLRRDSIYTLAGVAIGTTTALVWPWWGML